MRKFVFLVAVAVAVAPCYVLAARVPGSAFDALATISQSLVYAIVIGVPLAVAEAFVFSKRRRLPFALSFLAKTAAYATWIVTGVTLVGWFTHDHDAVSWEDMLLHKGLLIASAVTAALLNVVLTVGRLLGPRTLFQIVSGRYHQPRREERVIAFVDVRSATTLAETLGDIRFQAFLVDVFRIVEVTALEAGGEIHDYVGDQVMITWLANRRGRAGSAEPLRWLFELDRQIADAQPRFRSDYGHLPELRIGMHLGSVVVGEVSVFRTKLACLGDAVNTAARVEELAHDHRGSALVSEEVLQRFPLPPDLFVATSLGNALLRGKRVPIAIHRLTPVVGHGPT